MIRNVIVLGGGSAGFMAALALRLKLPHLKVAVIRSGEIGIIGVGEGSTGTLTDFLHNYLNVGRKKFYEIANPTWKLGLRFIWGPRPYFNYTFGPGLEVRSDPQQPKPNGFFCAQDIEYTDPISAMMTHERVFARSAAGKPVPHVHVAYHFENEKYVRFLEEGARAVGVRIVDDTVSEVRQNEAGISGLVLKSGDTESADLYVDCSGFSSLLLGKSLGEPFVSYESSLFCDRAVVGGWDRADPEDQVIKPYTTCQTMNSGWCWQIEHENRINRGYVYSSSFISDADAEAEFRAAAPKVGATRVVRFASGRRERAWVKNVVAIGNASGFVEPLEATALGVIGKQSRALAETLVCGDGQPRPTQVTAYNRMNADFWDNIRRFLAIHYRFNTRLDTPFWRHCRQHIDLTGAEEILEFYSENGPDPSWGPMLLGNANDQFGISGYFTMLVGMGVPFRRTWEPSDAQARAFDSRRRQFKELALKSMTVRQTLEAIRAPDWVWS